MAKELWIYAEQNNGIVAPAFYEILSKAKSVFAGEEDVRFTAVALSAKEETAEQLKTCGADRILLVLDERFDAYRPDVFTAALTALAKEYQPEYFLIAASAQGGELAPSVAARLNTGLVAHCVDLRLDENGTLHMIVPAFGGKLMGENVIPKQRPVMASIKPGVFERAALPAKMAEIVKPSMACLTDLPSGMELVKSEPITETELPIEKAEVLVCAGLGSAVSGNFEKVKDFTKRIGASLCYTRPLSDLGYVPNEHAMVGASGKTVKPKLYIGFGVSGAAQHACGMKDSGVIINVNSDAEADCFKYSNYKIASDCGAILDELLKQI